MEHGANDYAPLRSWWTRSLETRGSVDVLPHAHPCGACAQDSEGASGVCLPKLLSDPDEVGVHDDGGAVALLEVGVGDAHPLEVAAGDDVHPGAVEALGKLGLQVDLIDLVQDLYGSLTVEHEGVPLTV